MKLPISWMQDWIEVDASVDDVAGALTRRGFYVEGVERHGRAYPGVVVARVLEVRKHPNADKLSLCLVDTGAGTLQIVCGAPNVVPGMIAPLATIGATLPGGTTIRKSKIRGEESQGMLCSARELELSEDHQGILDLTTLDPGAAKLALGSPFDRLLPPPDAVLEIETPFNRPDGLGIIGLAREVKAAFGGRWTEAAQARLARGATDGAAFDLAIEDAEGCPRYIAQVIDGVRIGPSPAWVRDRLALMGQRPINNVVDATNLVLFELSQPLHAFDLARLGGPAIRVRRARAGESIVTLDGKSRALDPDVLVIADRERAVAVAGVMGGADSEVTDATRSLLLECAVFDARRVRRGARRLGLATEASRRYERGIDPHIGPAAVARFIEVVRETCPELTLGAARDVIASATEPRRVTLRRSRVERIAGLDIPDAEIVRHLSALEFGVEPAGSAARHGAELAARRRDRGRPRRGGRALGRLRRDSRGAARDGRRVRDALARREAARAVTPRDARAWAARGVERLARVGARGARRRAPARPDRRADRAAAEPDEPRGRGAASESRAGAVARVRAQPESGARLGAAVRGRHRVQRGRSTARRDGRCSQRSCVARRTRTRTPTRACRRRTRRCTRSTSAARRACGRPGSKNCALTHPSGGPILAPVGNSVPARNLQAALRALVGRARWGRHCSENGKSSFPSTCSWRCSIRSVIRSVASPSFHRESTRPCVAISRSSFRRT
jgi:tRNA-binding EMAP/Myf-like protein